MRSKPMMVPGMASSWRMELRTWSDTRIEVSFWRPDDRHYPTPRRYLGTGESLEQALGRALDSLRCNSFAKRIPEPAAVVEKLAARLATEGEPEE